MKLKERKFYPWLVVILLMVVSLLNYLDRQMLSTMRPYMVADFPQLQAAENFGRLMAIFLWIYAFLSPFSGMIADRLNRKWLIVGSLFVWSSITIAMGYVTSFNILYVLRGLMGISEAFYIPAALSLAADYHQGTTRSKALGILTAGVYLGTICGGFGATVADATSWQSTFKIFGLIGVIYSFVLIALINEKKAFSVSVQKSSFSKELKDSASGLKILFSNPAFWVMLYFFAALSLPGWVTKNWLPTLVSESLEIPMKQAGPLAATSLACSSLIGVFIGGWLADRWSLKCVKGRVMTSATGLIMTIPALFLLNFGKLLVPEALLAVIIVSAVLFGMGFGMYDANNMPILCQFFPARYRATGYGLMNFVGIAGGALITTQLGRAMDNGNQDMVFGVMIAAVVIAVILQLLVLKPETLDMTDEMLQK